MFSITPCCTIYSDSSTLLTVFDSSYDVVQYTLCMSKVPTHFGNKPVHKEMLNL